MFLILLPVFASSTESTEAGVTQTPRNQVTTKGQLVTLSCEPISGHPVLYWYSQTLGQEPQMMIYFLNEVPVNKAGMPNDRFSAQMLNASFSTLKIQPTEPGDSAVYLCASSSVTALQRHPLPVQKPSCFPFSSTPAILSSLCRLPHIRASAWVWCPTSPYGRQEQSPLKVPH